MNFFTHLILGFILTTQFAFAKHDNGLKLAIDDFHYSMTVEWDQKDPSFAAHQEEVLLKKINDFIQSGATREDLEEAFYEITKLKLTDVENELSIKQVQSSLEIRDLLQLKLESSYTKGASWDAGGAALGAVAAVLLGMVILGAATTIKDCASSTYGNSNC